MRIYNAIILNDYVGKHYATWVKEQIKTIETRMVMFSYRGEIVICCGNKSTTRNAGRALCIVNLYDAVPMLKEHEKQACIECVPGRVSHLLKEWKYFNRDFMFSRRRISGSFQSIFQILLPDDVTIIDNQPAL